jgi:hypothetical protein
MKTNITIARIAPFVAVAAFPFITTAVRNLCELVSLTIYYFNVAIYMIIALATVIFIWNVYRYFFKADIENKKEAGLYVMYSIIGFFVIISFWGLVNIVKNTFNLDTQVPSSLSGGAGGSVSSGCGGGGGSNVRTSGGTVIPSGSYTQNNTGTSQQPGFFVQLYNDLLGSGNK